MIRCRWGKWMSECQGVERSSFLRSHYLWPLWTEGTDPRRTLKCHPPVSLVSRLQGTCAPCSGAAPSVTHSHLCPWLCLLLRPSSVLFLSKWLRKGRETREDPVRVFLTLRDTKQRRGPPSALVPATFSGLECSSPAPLPDTSALSDWGQGVLPLNNLPGLKKLVEWWRSGGWVRKCSLCWLEHPFLTMEPGANHLTPLSINFLSSNRGDNTATPSLGLATYKGTWARARERASGPATGEVGSLKGERFPHPVRWFSTPNTRSFHTVGHVEGNSCWSKPILETRVFSKGRARFHHNKVAGTGQARPDSNAEMVQQVSAENQLLVLGWLLQRSRRRWGRVGWVAVRILPLNLEMSQSGGGGGADEGHWDGNNPSARSTKSLSLNLGSSPSRGSLPFLPLSLGLSPYSALNSNLGNWSQRKERLSLNQRYLGNDFPLSLSTPDLFWT